MYITLSRDWGSSDLCFCLCQRSCLLDPASDFSSVPSLIGLYCWDVLPADWQTSSSFCNLSTSSVIGLWDLPKKNLTSNCGLLVAQKGYSNPQHNSLGSDGLWLFDVSWRGCLAFSPQTSCFLSLSAYFLGQVVGKCRWQETEGKNSAGTILYYE